MERSHTPVLTFFDKYTQAEFLMRGGVVGHPLRSGRSVRWLREQVRHWRDCRFCERLPALRQVQTGVVHPPRANLLYSPRNKILATSLLVAFLYEEQIRRGISLRHWQEFEDVIDHCSVCHKCLSPCYLYHDPCHSPMKLQDPMKTVKALVGNNVLKNERCCGESGTLGVTRPDIATQVRFRKEEELRKGEIELRALAKLPEKANVKILTSCPSCPSCLQGLTRYGNDLQNGLLEADYIVVEMANQILGEDWMPNYVAAANAGGIERVLV